MSALQAEKEKAKDTGADIDGNVVVVENLQKSFGDLHVLRDISFTIAKGENLGVMGKSGTGKSVLIKCMVGLLYPDAGKVMVLGKSIPELSEDELDKVRLRIGFLFQSAALYDSMTVRENLEFPLRELPPIPQSEKNTLVEEVLENVGLKEAIDKMPSELSGGMRKRVGLARTLILKPELILYDEPTTGLDPITSREISHLILDVQKKYNSASIIITHDKECAQITTNRIIVINEGLEVAKGTYEEVIKSEDPWVKSFFA